MITLRSSVGVVIQISFDKAVRLRDSTLQVRQFDRKSSARDLVQRERRHGLVEAAVLIVKFFLEDLGMIGELPGGV